MSGNSNSSIHTLASAAVSPAPLGFIAPGTLFAPARHAAHPGRRTGLLITTSALAVLFLLVSVGFAVAFVNRNNAYHRQATTVKQRDTTIASRCTDATGYVQPSRESLIAVRGVNSGFHFNGIKFWKISANGSVTNA